MFFLLDNYDSFVYNLYAYFNELGQEVIVKRPNEVSLSEIEMMNVKGIIISPGPGHPKDAVFALELIERFKGKIPIFGVCLGHQTIGHYFNLEVKKGASPMHGKVTPITNNGKNLFKELPNKFKVTRYHSLVVNLDENNKDFEIDALSEDGSIMAITHKEYPIYGVQFHPEAILTEYGYQILDNFIKICEKEI